MNQPMMDRIAHAVLYEGYILYPYRPSTKNRQRWTFGGLFPRDYCRDGSDNWAMQTECLLEGNDETIVQIKVRFLHLLDRQIGVGDESDFRPVESLQVGARLLQTWQEAVERLVDLGELELGTLTRPLRREVAFDGCKSIEPVHEEQVAGVIVREQQQVLCGVEVVAERAGSGLFKLRVRVENHTPSAGRNRDDALLRALVSTHTLLGSRGGGFVSLIDPPGHCRAAAESCQNIGTWPVLVGAPGATDTMLSAPIILYDYPQVAPESPGDLFDATEIDEILSLRIMTLTEDEKQQAAALDERARALLERTETLAHEQLMGLHGTMRGLKPVENAS